MALMFVNPVEVKAVEKLESCKDWDYLTEDDLLTFYERWALIEFQARIRQYLGRPSFWVVLWQ